MARVSLKNFSFRYRKNQAPILSDISFEFSTDERILIVGPSGGKSTLLLAILHLYKAFDTFYAEGKKTYEGKEGDQMSRRDFLEMFGVVFQSPSHQFCLSQPDQEAAFGLENLMLPPHQMQDMIDSTFLRFNFTKREVPISHLSGGEQQVLAAASTTLLDPLMLVMDEPTSHLDPSGRRRLRRSVESWLTPEKGFLLIEHHTELWLDLVDRVVVLDHGGNILFDEKGVEVFTRERAMLAEMGIWLPFPVLELPRVSSALPAGGEEPEVEFNGCSIGYGKQTILEDISLCIPRGEMVAFAGENGCGKSTLLNSLAGLSEIQKGTIRFNGEKASRKKKRLLSRREIAYLFQNPEVQFIYPTVAAELCTPEEGVPDGDLLSRLSLEGKEHQSPFTLSGGEKRRLSLASLISSEHRLYCLDEPTFGQDAQSAKHLVSLIGELKREGKTILMVSHDLPLFLHLLDRIIVIHEKVIVFDGSAEELRQVPEGDLAEWGVEV